MKIKVLYEDADIVAIDKPSGIAVHPAPEHIRHAASSDSAQQEFITDWVLETYPETADVGEPLGDTPRPGVVHRLDRETSGVLLLAKTKEAHAFLKKQFSAAALELKTEGGLPVTPDRIRKTYVAIVSGWVKDDRGTIDKSIGRSPSDFRRWLAGRGARGELREAITVYRVMKRFEEDGNRFTVLEVRPKTGRTHQIRVHMKYLNHPVVCDELYSPGKPCPHGLSRLGLHARSIEFRNLAGQTIKVESPLPEEFLRYI